MRAGLAFLTALAGACAAPAGDAPEQPVRAVVISDLNASYGSTHYPPEVRHAIRHITTWRPDLVLIAGDMVAGQQPSLPDSVVRAMWAAFDSVIAAPLRSARIPLVATMGNHDASAYPAHARDRRLAVDYWRSAETQLLAFTDRRHYPLRYAVRYGDVFVAVWDATNQESSRKELVDWLRDVLRSREALTASHRVVLAHLPLYGIAVGRDQAGEVLADADELRSRLEQWDATLFISGHHHAYYPGHRGRLDLLYSGALGDGPRPLVGSDRPARKAFSVLEFLRDSLAITTYYIGAEGGLQKVPLESLPPVICGSTGFVVRIDVVMSDACR